METLRIKGVVALANYVRRELARPISPSRRDELRTELVNSLEQIDDILRRHGQSVDHLPAPTRRAYHFLRTIDLDKPAAAAALGRRTESAPGGTFRIPRIRMGWDHLLFRLSVATTEEERKSIHGSILSMLGKINVNLRAQNLTAEALNTNSRTIRAAIAFLADRASFDRYTAAIDRARPAFENVIARTKRYVPPVQIEFRPQTTLYRVRGCRSATHVSLPMAMIVFTGPQFEALAEAAIARGDKKPLLDAARTNAYQALQAQVEEFSETGDETAGTHHDLSRSFDRINAEYFGGELPCPRLGWSEGHTYRKLGQYDLIRDKVTISRSLDSHEVPAFTLDFVVYHELLHKVLGIEGRNGRLHAHTSEFRKRERQFKQFAEAEAVLKKVGVSPS